MTRRPRLVSVGWPDDRPHGGLVPAMLRPVVHAQKETMPAQDDVELVFVRSPKRRIIEEHLAHVIVSHADGVAEAQDGPDRPEDPKTERHLRHQTCRSHALNPLAGGRRTSRPAVALTIAPDNRVPGCSAEKNIRP